MNTQHITQELDRIAYLEALVMLARLEDGINQQKMDFIQMQAALLGIDINPLLEKTGDLFSIKHENMNRLTKMSIIRECISFAYIDGVYTQPERESVCKIADQFSISRNDVDAMERWLKEYWLLLQKGNELLGLNNN